MHSHTLCMKNDTLAHKAMQFCFEKDQPEKEGKVQQYIL